MKKVLVVIILLLNIKISKGDISFCASLGTEWTNQSSNLYVGDPDIIQKYQVH